MLDSNDRERLPECKDEIWRMLGEDELKTALLLVMANKQDLPNAMSVEEITEKLELNKLRDREWRKSSVYSLWLCLVFTVAITYLALSPFIFAASRYSRNLCHHW